MVKMTSKRSFLVLITNCEKYDDRRKFMRDTIIKLFSFQLSTACHYVQNVQSFHVILTGQLVRDFIVFLYKIKVLTMQLMCFIDE